MNPSLRGALAAAFALGLSLGAPIAAHAACQMIVNSEVEIRFAENRPLVPVSVNGQPAWMLMDTGAYASTLYEGAAKDLGVQGYDTGYMSSGVGGESHVYRAKIGEFQFGKSKVKDFDINIGGGLNMGAGGRGDARRVVGLLGRDFFGLTDAVELDFANGKLRLLTFKDCGGGRSWAYWNADAPYIQMGREGIRQTEFFFPLKLNGAYVRAILDSGASNSVITPQIAARAGINPDSMPVIGRAVGLGARRVEMRLATFDTVELGDEKINKAQIAISELFREDNGASTGTKVGGGGTPMLLGADFLHSHHVLIASEQDRIYFTYNGGPVFHKYSTDPDPYAQPPKPAAP